MMCIDVFYEYDMIMLDTLVNKISVPAPLQKGVSL